jgi:hypothetical protein
VGKSSETAEGSHCFLFLGQTECGHHHAFGPPLTRTLYLAGLGFSLSVPEANQARQGGPPLKHMPQDPRCSRFKEAQNSQETTEAPFLGWFRLCWPLQTTVGMGYSGRVRTKNVRRQTRSGRPASQPASMPNERNVWGPSGRGMDGTGSARRVQTPFSRDVLRSRRGADSRTKGTDPNNDNGRHPRCCVVSCRVVSCHTTVHEDQSVRIHTTMHAHERSIVRTVCAYILLTRILWQRRR